MSKVIDFTRPTWGHVLHSDFFHAKVADKWLDRWRDKRHGRRRYTVLVHSCEYIKKGDKIRYTSEKRQIEATVHAAKWCLDPKDMATLEIVICDE